MSYRSFGNTPAGWPTLGPGGFVPGTSTPLPTGVVAPDGSGTVPFPTAWKDCGPGFYWNPTTQSCLPSSGTIDVSWPGSGGQGNPGGGATPPFVPPGPVPVPGGGGQPPSTPPPAGTPLDGATLAKYAVLGAAIYLVYKALTEPSPPPASFVSGADDFDDTGDRPTLASAM